MMLCFICQTELLIQIYFSSALNHVTRKILVKVILIEIANACNSNHTEDK